MARCGCFRRIVISCKFRDLVELVAFFSGFFIDDDPSVGFFFFDSGFCVADGHVATWSSYDSAER